MTDKSSEQEQHETCDICDEPLSNDEAVDAGGIMQVHPECHPESNIPDQLNPESPFHGDMENNESR